MKIKSGLIVSIQKYTLQTTQELAEHAILAGAVAIRADQPIDVSVPIIGLVKIPDAEYYITTDIELIHNVAEWADYVGIDCRKGNPDLLHFLKKVQRREIPFVADIQTMDDYNNLIDNDIHPDYIATTFSMWNTNDVPDIEMLRILCNVSKTPIIAEGGYTDRYYIEHAIAAGAHCICVGKAISKIYEKTKDYVDLWRTI